MMLHYWTEYILYPILQVTNHEFFKEKTCTELVHFRNSHNADPVYHYCLPRIIGLHMQ